jgi:hypothetical protein
MVLWVPLSIIAWKYLDKHLNFQIQNYLNYSKKWIVWFGPEKFTSWKIVRNWQNQMSPYERECNIIRFKQNSNIWNGIISLDSLEFQWLRYDFERVVSSLEFLLMTMISITNPWVENELNKLEHESDDSRNLWNFNVHANQEKDSSSDQKHISRVINWDSIKIVIRLGNHRWNISFVCVEHSK